MAASMVYAEASLLGDERTTMEQISVTHAPNGTKLDLKSLLNIVTNILNRASQIVDGAITGTQAHLEKVEDKLYQLDFEAPSPMIEKLSCEMMCSCKVSDPVNLHETTLSMFRKLSGYSWDAKVVLALSAYAVNYGDFWLLDQIYPQNQLAKPMALLKGMSVLAKPTGPLKSRVVAISALTKTILEVTECIVKIEKLSVKNNPTDVPALAKAMSELPMAVYLTIKTVIACASQITSLTTTVDESHTALLSTLAPKLNMTLGMLKEFLTHCRISIEENQRYQMLMKLTITPTDNVEVLKAIIYTKNDTLIDLSTKKPAKIDSLRRKRVLLLVSGLDISTEVITTLKQTYDSRRVQPKGIFDTIINGGAQEQNRFEVVWIPVVEKLSEEAQERFRILKAAMPWYTVQSLSVTDSAVLKFFKQVWHYQGNPIIPVLSHEGNFESQNALHMIKVWGSEAFPFTEVKRIELWKEHKDITTDLIVGDLYPEVATLIREEQFVLFYGGTNAEWIKKLEESAKSFAEGINSGIALVNINHGNTRFWDRVETLLMSKMHHESQEVDEALHQIQKLFGYKKQEKWGMLCRGSKLLIGGQDNSVLDVLSQDASSWYSGQYPTDLGMILVEFHNKVTSLDSGCCHYAFPTTAGKVPDTLKCLHCSRVMERFVTFRCCHKDEGAITNGPC